VAALNDSWRRFGDPFNSQLYRLVFDSSEPVNVNAIGAIERGIEKVANYINELTSFGLEMAEVKDDSAPLNAKKDLEKLLETGAISRALAEDLQDLRELRKNLAHDYPGVRAQSVRDAALIAADRYPDFEQAFRKWKDAGFPART